MVINCPSCSNSFQVTVQAVDHTGKKYTADSPITPAAMRAVFEFIQMMGSGRYANQILFDAYQRWEGEKGWPELSSQAFTMALKRNGCEKWRNPSTRGWILPKVEPLRRPAPVAPSVKRELEEQEYRETVLSQRGVETVPVLDPLGLNTPTHPKPDLSDLPFEIEEF